MKIYTIGGTKWYQDELLFEEAQQLRELRKVYLEELETRGTSKLGDFFDRLFAEGKVRKMVLVALKPYEPNPWRKLVNHFYAWKNGVDRANLIASMTESQVWEALADFFYYSGLSTTSFVSLLSESTFRSPKIPTS